MSLETDTNASRAANDDHICGSIAGLPISGQQTFRVSGTDLPFSTEQTVKLGFGVRLDGSVFVEAPGQWNWSLHGCNLIPVEQACDATLQRSPMPDGTWTVGFSLSATSATAETAKLSWAIPDPDPGFFDADESVCYVFSIWKAEFDVAYEERGTFILTMHPHVIGHRARMAMLDRLVTYMKSKPGVWFATCEQIARYVAKEAGMKP